MTAKSLLRRLFHLSAPQPEPRVNFLIVGLGNIGDEYARTRHNIGFRVVDALAAAAGLAFDDRRYGSVATLKVKNQTLLLLKPSTYMNLSGNAVRYWMNEKKIPVERLLVVVDDLSLPFGQLRLKTSGSDGGHNGLKHIASVLGTQQYARLRIGIGNEFPRGGQIDYVLGEFGEEDLSRMDECLRTAGEIVKTFCLSGPDVAMNRYNHRKPPRQPKAEPGAATAPQE